MQLRRGGGLSRQALAHRGGVLQVRGGPHVRQVPAGRAAELGARRRRLGLRVPHPQPEPQAILNRRDSSERIYKPTEEQGWLRGPEEPLPRSRLERVAGTSLLALRKQGHGSDTNGNLWGRPLCRWRNERRTERQHPSRGSGGLRLPTAGHTSISRQGRRPWGLRLLEP